MADVDTLIKDLKTGDYYARSTAARALGEIGGEKASVALIEALGDEDDWVQEYAANALGKLGHKPAVEPLGRLLESESYKVRIAVVEALGKIGGDEARRLLEPLREDSDSWVREAAIQALEKLSHRREPAQPVQEQRAPIPSQPEAEPDPTMTISEEPAEPEQQPVPPAPRLEDRLPRTPEEIVELITADTSIKYKATRSGFLLRAPVGGGRHQRVRLKFDSTDEDGSPLIQIFTIIGPATPKYYEWALKLNPGFSYGAIGLVKIDDKEFFAIMDTVLEETADVKALQKSVWNLAKRGDALEKKLVHKDLW